MGSVILGMLTAFRKESAEVTAGVNEKDTKLIKNTEFEELMRKINEEDVQPREIFFDIMAVYIFMCNKMGMRSRPISIDEFEIIEAEMNKQPNIHNHNISSNEQYLYLPGNTIHCFFPNSSWKNFDVFAKFPMNEHIPPNIIELMCEIYEKRFGRSIPRPQ